MALSTHRSTDPSTTAPAPARTLRAATFGATGMACVGGSVAVSGVLADAPLFTVQSLRYAVACGLLLVAVRLTGRPMPRPRGGSGRGSARSRWPGWSVADRARWSSPGPSWRARARF